MGEKFDDASWHAGGDFPKDLPQEAGGTHIGMFVAWAFLSGLVGEVHCDDVEPLQLRSMTPGAFFLDACDGKFTDETLNDEGTLFAKAYYDQQYSDDYFAALVGNALPSVYHVQDSWSNFDKLRPVLNGRFLDWKNQQAAR